MGRMYDLVSRLHQLKVDGILPDTVLRSLLKFLRTDRRRIVINESRNGNPQASQLIPHDYARKKSSGSWGYHV